MENFRLDMVIAERIEDGIITVYFNQTVQCEKQQVGWNTRSVGADLGFPVGWGADPRSVGRGGVTYNFAKFAQNCMELRKFWAVGAPLLDPPNDNYQ